MMRALIDVMLLKKTALPLSAFLLATTAVSASTLTLSGSLSNDSDLGIVSFTLAAPADVTLQTISFDGGTAADGTVVPPGGFDTILTFFDSSGLLVDQNDDGPIGSDSLLFESGLAAGSYTAIISQFDNFANGSTLAEGFYHDGNGNYTGLVCGEDGASFLTLNTCEQRTPRWALTLANVDSASVVSPTTPVPEPSSVAFTVVGLIVLMQYRRRSHAHGKLGYLLNGSVPSRSNH